MKETSQEPLRPARPWKAVLFGSCVGCLTLVALIVIAIVVVIGKGIGEVSSITAPVTETHLSGTGPEKVAIIPLHGVIMGDTDVVDGAISARTIETMVRQANDDPSVRAVIVDIDSPGGGVVASRRIYDALKDLDANKPVIALYNGEVAASGGVYSSMGARTIVAQPDTLTGSIGVISEFYDISELMKQYGVKNTVIKSGQFKDIGSFSRPMTDDERALLQTLIDESYNRFITVIADSRDLSKETVRGFADGRVFSGTQAKELGLVDELGDQKRAIDLAEQAAHIANAEIVEYEPPFSFSSLFGTLTTKVSPLDALSLIQKSREQPQFELMYLLE